MDLSDKMVPKTEEEKEKRIAKPFETNRREQIRGIENMVAEDDIALTF